MDELFEQFARGEMPNIIEVMQAISDLANFWPGDVCLDCRPRQDTDSALKNTPESIFKPDRVPNYPQNEISF